VIYPSLQPGSELAWASLAGETPPSFVTEIFRHLVFKDPTWDFRSVPFDSLITAPTGISASFNPMNPDLKAFFERHGKLLLYHGWNDAVNAPGSSVAYYQSVLKTVGRAAKTKDSIRLFMAPGMGHCGGGDGPNAFDGMSALRAWVEGGKTPASILASHSTNGEVDRTRPLCPYPQIARYKGYGSIDDAANFVCRAP
jgi:feruloyl esterase